MKKYVDISSFSTISHFHFYGDFVLELHVLDNIWCTTVLDPTTVFSMLLQFINGTKNHHEKCLGNTCALWTNFSYILPLLCVYGNDRDHALWEVNE